MQPTGRGPRRANLMALHGIWLSVQLLVTASAGFGPAVLAAGTDAAQPWEPMLRRLDLTKAGIVNQSAPLFTDEYTHADYKFTLRRDEVQRDGHGEVWLSFHKDQGPRLRLRGQAQSQRFGHGEITIVVDTAEKIMYALFKLDRLHQEQCIKYPFPNLGENNQRMKFLRWRKEQVMQWKQKEQALFNDGLEPPLLEVNWTKSYSLKWSLEAGSKRIRGFEMRNRANPGSEDSVVKSVVLSHVEGGNNPENIDDLFRPPATVCKLDDSVPDVERLAEVELKPPHHKSSALNDLLLVLQDHQRSDSWEQLFVALSVITVPGDVSVLIEDPVPPDLSKLHNVRFDYRAFVTAGDRMHTSEGAIWLGLDKNRRTFRLKGEAMGTKVGDLTMDLIAQGGDKVFANVNLTDQFTSQCVVYDYPTVGKDEKTSLHMLESQGLTFFAIDELDGEDCGIFVAELARGRWLHIWVDLEQTQPGMILRSEVHKNGDVLRSTDMLRWSAGGDVEIGVKPKDEWGCQPYHVGDQQLAELGLDRPVHTKSIQLQDTLYALQRLHPDFALLEVLGLTGDVGMLVQEPTPPELWRLPAVMFSYSVSLGVGIDDESSDAAIRIAGNFAANFRTNTIVVTAGVDTPGATNVTIAFEPDELAVKVVEPDGKISCLTFPVKDSDLNDERPQESLGLFLGVEEIDESECDRWSYVGTGPHQESVQFWFSMGEAKVCRLQVQTDGSDGFDSVLIDIPEWNGSYSPPGGVDDQGPAGWNCNNAADSQNSWLSLPAAKALAKLTEASGVVGLLPEKFTHMLSRVVVTSPSEADKTSSGAEATSIDCDDFSGEWSTSVGSASAVMTQKDCTLSVTSLSDDDSLISGSAERDTITIASLNAVGHLDGNEIKWDAGFTYSWIRGTADSKSESVPVSVLSEDLQTFSFSFKSVYPLGGDKGMKPADGEMTYSPTSNAGEAMRTSQGEIHVDLANRCMYISSSATDVSTGIPRVSSKIIFRGDHAKLYVRTRLDFNNYDQCWMANTTQLPSAEGKRQPNPFQYSDHAGDCKVLSSGGINCKERRISWLDSSKRLEFFIDDLGRLVGMVLDDIERDIAAGITIQNFSTRPSSSKRFEPTDTAMGKCKDLLYLPDADRIAEWNIIRAFFPLESPTPAVDRDKEETRRLFAI